MIYGYARCSTKDKQEIDRQVKELEAHGACSVFREYGSGTDQDREKLLKLLNTAKEGDTIIVTELSRMTRNLHHLCHIIEWAADRRVVLKVGAITIDFTNYVDPMVEGMLYMMGIFSQMEQKIIVQRVKSGVKHAKAKGKKLGRPAITKDNLPKAFTKHYDSYKCGRISISALARLVGCSRQSIYRYISLIES